MASADPRADLPKLLSSSTDTRDNNKSFTVHTIPPEVLSIIFQWGKNMIDDIPLSSTAEGDIHRDTAPFEVIVSHTCSYFRKVALANPRLWTSIHIYAPCRLRCIIEAIARSGACGLDIRIDLTVQEPQMDDVMLGQMMDLILPQSHRWRSLSVGYSCERSNYPMITRLCDTHAPGLQHLSITVEDVDRADASIVNRSVELPHIFKEGTPKLEFVRLRGLAIQLFRPQLDALVTLHIDQTRSLPLLHSTFRDIVTRSPFLANLSIYGDIIDPADWPGQANSIYLPNLRTLRICSAAGEMYAAILLEIDAPMLESLTLKDLQEHDLDLLWNLADSTRHASIRSLIFTDFDLTSLTYEHIFQTFQGITDFSTVYSVRESPLMGLLSEGMVEGLDGLYVPWPRLKTLAFSFDVYGDDEEVIEVVAAVRKQGGFPLSTILLRRSADEMEEIPLESFDAGSDVEVKFFTEDQVWPENRTFFDNDDILF
ncbi:hypothetical protein BDZ97DRAFT_643584 [Flammula alnicola]|nr:hypothetical protein BDZ97DRAFT_643584 [Flammula alnicola]